MRYSKILLAIVLISMLVFGSSINAFAVVKYDLTVSVGEGMGSVDGGGKYEPGTEVTVTAIPDEGYQFVKWESSCTGETNDLSVPSLTYTTHNHDVTLSAVFKLEGADLYHLNIKSNNQSMGTVSSSGNYEFEEAVPVIATPAEGYQFVKWVSSCTGETNDLSKPSITYIMHKHDVTLTAYFEEKTYKIITSVDGDVNQDTKGSVIGGGIYRYTEDVNIVATPKDGYKFVKWMADFGDGNFVAPGFEDPIIQCNLSHCGNGYFAEIELRAYFELIEEPTEPTTAATTEAPTEPTTAATTEAPTEPTTAATTEAPTEPTTAATTETPTQPTTAATTETPTQPTTAATTAATTEDDDEVVTITIIPTTSPATEATEVVTEEGVPLGAAGILNFDEIYEEPVRNFDEFVEDEPLVGTDVMVEEGEEVLDDEVPLADGLPQTGQVSADMFYGIGGLISGLGLWLKRKK